MVGRQNVYVNVKGDEFILSKVVNRICQDYGFQKLTVLYRTEVTETEFWANRTANPELCCFVLFLNKKRIYVFRCKQKRNTARG